MLGAAWIAVSVLTMTDHAQQILADAFGRVRELVIDLTDGLTDEIATYRPDPGANSIAWLIWHLSRIQDDHVAGLARSSRRGPRGRRGLAFLSARGPPATVIARNRWPRSG